MEQSEVKVHHQINNKPFRCCNSKPESAIIKNKFKDKEPVKLPESAKIFPEFSDGL